MLAQVCRPDVVPVDNEELAYKSRGDRCEGLVARPVSAGLRLLGFHRHPPQLGSGCGGSSGEPLSVTAYADAEKKVQLRALSTRRSLHYRMDATLPPGRSMTWDRELLQHPEVCLRSEEIAVLACAEECETVALRLYPVSVTVQNTEPPSAGKLFLVFRAGVDLDELHLTIREKNTGNVVGIPGNVLKATMPAEMTIPVPIDELESGEYQLSVIALPRGRMVAAAVLDAVLDVQSAALAGP